MEHRGVAEEHLGAAEHQVAAAVHREVEAPHDARLCLRVEVHQGIAAEQQVHAGDRRVLDQIVAPEDDRPPELTVERVQLAAVAIEVLLQEIGGHVRDLLLAVDRAARLGERLVVHVGGVDLHAIAKGVDPDRFGQHDGGTVGFLSRRAPRAPDADGGAVFRQVLEHDCSQRLPHLGIAEERRHVDQDRVEQRGELVGVDLQVVEIAIELVNLDRLHPLAHAAHQAGRLVGGEVEAAVLPEVLDDAFESGLLRWV